MLSEWLSSNKGLGESYIHVDEDSDQNIDLTGYVSMGYH